MPQTQTQVVVTWENFFFFFFLPAAELESTFNKKIRGLVDFFQNRTEKFYPIVLIPPISCDLFPSFMRLFACFFSFSFRPFLNAFVPQTKLRFASLRFFSFSIGEKSLLNILRGKQMIPRLVRKQTKTIFAKERKISSSSSNKQKSNGVTTNRCCAQSSLHTFVWKGSNYLSLSFFSFPLFLSPSFFLSFFSLLNFSLSFFLLSPFSLSSLFLSLSVCKNQIVTKYVRLRKKCILRRFSPSFKSPFRFYLLL